MEPAYQIEHFVTHDGRQPFAEWTRRLRDTRLRIAIDRRTNRLIDGNFGDHKFCRDGVWELRIDYGPGYRIYYALVASSIILLWAGSKSTQSADIDKARSYWQELQQRGPR